MGRYEHRRSETLRRLNNSKIIYPDILSTQRTLRQTQFIIRKLNVSLRIWKCSYQCHVFKALDQTPSKHCSIWHSSNTHSLLIALKYGAFSTCISLDGGWETLSSQKQCTNFLCCPEQVLLDGVSYFNHYTWTVCYQGFSTRGSQHYIVGLLVGI